MALPEDMMVVGDKVDMVVEQGRVFRTMIEDTTGNGLFLVGVPSRGGIPVPIKADDEVQLLFFRESGVFITLMGVVGFEKKGEVRYAWLVQKTKPERTQRRDAFRVESMLGVLVNEYREGMEKKLSRRGYTDETALLEAASCKDISVTGVAIRTRRKYETGERYFLKLFFDEPQKKTLPFSACAEVTRLSLGIESSFNTVGMHFFGLSESDSETLSRFVFERQRELIKQKRLVEEED